MAQWLQIQSNRLAKARRIARALIWAGRNRSIPRPRLLDIGARGGLQPKWEVLRRLGLIEPVLAEPNAEERERLRARYPNIEILPYAISGGEEDRDLFVTMSPGLSSLLKPELEIIEVACEPSQYQIIDRERVHCVALSALRSSNVLKRCQFVKIDTQGMEYNILVGLDEYIHEVIGIELESRFVHVYQAEKTVSEITQYLFSRGFELMAIRPLGLSRRGIIEVNLVFTRSGPLDQRDEAYKNLFDKVLGLSRDSFSFSIKSE